MSFIKTMLKRNREARRLRDKTSSNSQIDLIGAQYILGEIYVGNLAKHLDKANIRNNRDVEQSIIGKDKMFVAVDCDTYMDIETGKCYQTGTFFEQDNLIGNKPFIFGVNPLYYMCYPTIKHKNLQPNDKFTYNELRSLYLEHINKNEVSR